MQQEVSLTTKKVSDSSQPNDAYNTYQTKCIRLLNELMSCPKQPDPVSKTETSGDKHEETSGDKHEETSGVTSAEKTTTEPIKSSTSLKHNGKVGDLEDLIFFLIKSPTTDPIKTKLNDVYKIFNPNARDILSKPTPVPTTPVPTPTPKPE
jgi:hypothetical protein